MLIAQITDTHIVDKHKHWMSEPLTKTSERLEKVVAYLNALNPIPDVVLLTGDISDTGTEASYHHFKELVQPLKIPLYVIPGNHDSPQEMRKAFAKYSYMPSEGFIHYAIDDYPVRLVGLDTHVPNQSYGRLCKDRFSWTVQALHSNEKPTLLFMHHPPVKTGTKLFDTMNCSVPKEFETLISRQSNFLGMITGHYHHLCVASYGGKLCFIAPSVAPVHYFANPQDDGVTALEIEDPAITLHKWHGGNVLTSHVVRLKEQYHRIDWSLIKKT
jgi:3',5'-cyclic-AMP phosphodiesterase